MRDIPLQSARRLPYGSEVPIGISRVAPHSHTQAMSLDDFLRFELIQIRGTTVTVGAVLTAILIVVAGWLLSTLLQRGVRRAWTQRASGHPGNVHALVKLAHYTVMLVAIGIALETVGVDLSTLFAAGAIVAIGIGFAMQNVAQNFVSGVILLMERTIRPNDLLEVEGQIVRVLRLGLRSTLVRTRFDAELIVPNSILVQSTIKNYTLRDPLYRVRAKVGVAYESDMKTVIETLHATARDFASRYKERDPIVLLTGFGDSSVDFEVSVWTDDAWNERLLLSQLNEAIWWALKKSKVTIAYPQRDVHLDAPVVEALQALASNRADS